MKGAASVCGRKRRRICYRTAARTPTRRTARFGLPDDSRDFSDAATLLKFFRGDGPFRLLTNNPKKVEDLTAAGLTEITPVKHVFGVTEANKRYLAAKQDWGHKIDEDDIS